MTSEIERKQEQREKAQTLLLAANLYQNHKLNSELKTLNSSNQQLVNLAAQNVHLQNETNQLLDEQTRLLRRQQQNQELEILEKQKSKELKNIFFDIVEETSEVQSNKSSNLEKYFQLESLKSIIEKNEISHRITDDLDDKKIISDSLKNIKNYSNELFENFSDEEINDFNTIVDILAVNEEEEIENVSSSDEFKIGSEVSDLYNLIKSILKEKPYLVFKIFDYKDALKEVRWKIHQGEKEIEEEKYLLFKYLPEIPFEEIFFGYNEDLTEYKKIFDKEIQNIGYYNHSELLSFRSILTINLFCLDFYEIEMVDKIVDSRKNWYKDFFKVSSFSFKKASELEKLDKYLVSYKAIGEFLNGIFSQSFERTFGIYVKLAESGDEKIKNLKIDIENETEIAKKIIEKYPFVQKILNNRQ